MTAMLIHIFVAFFAILNPIGNAPVFLGLVESQSAGAQRATARRGVLVAFLTVAMFVVLGNLIFRTFGITLPAFRIAGGILLFSVGYELLHARKSRMHHPKSSESNEDREEDTSDVAISPLAIPILAGPGTISTAMSLAAPNETTGHWQTILMVVGGLLVVCLITYSMFINAARLTEKLGQGLIDVMTRLMGMLLAVMSVQMIIDGVQGVINS